MSDIRELVYQLYILDWERRISVEREMDAMKNWYQETEPEDREKYTFADFLFENGYDGELYVCFEEFLGAEYLDKAYIKSLLDNDDLYAEYEDDVFVLQNDEEGANAE